MGLIPGASGHHATTRQKGGFLPQSQADGLGERKKLRSAWKSDEGAIPSAEEPDRAWNASLVPASITRLRDVGKVLDTESCREGVDSEERNGMAA